MINQGAHQVVCFGEVLWDILPSGSLPGGALMNVAYHLQKLEKNPAMITRIGLDEAGRDLVSIFSQHGLATDFFQADFEHETGKVYARVTEASDVEYEIVKPAAWDFIDWEDGFEQLVSNASHFVFGTLAARNRKSKSTLDRLIELANKKILDINLRIPFYNRKIVEELISKSDILKLNLAELELITGWFSNHTSIEDRVRSITDRFKLSEVVVTMGDKGACLFNGGVHTHPGFKVNVADTIGSGDAFLAGYIAKSLEGKSPEERLGFASAMGGFMATQSGGSPEYDIAAVHQLMMNAGYQKTI
jgi:fructokinase